MNKMIVSPHIDDEVLGCGGILDKDTFVLHCGLLENQQHGHNICTQKDRIKEFEKVKDALGLEYHLLAHPVNEYNISRLIPDIEWYINDIRPKEIYIPHPSYNQDHRAVYEACLTALRPHDINYFVKRVMVYEQPHIFFWNHNGKTFNPNKFVEIEIDIKIDLYELLESQVRSFRSQEHIRALAKVRGGQANMDYAEAFEIIRWC